MSLHMLPYLLFNRYTWSGYGLPFITSITGFYATTGILPSKPCDRPWVTVAYRLQRQGVPHDGGPPHIHRCCHNIMTSLAVATVVNCRSNAQTRRVQPLDIRVLVFHSSVSHQTSLEVDTGAPLPTEGTDVPRCIAVSL